ncbi:hypothetical protein F0562_028127 [Nyssa sinensis]|uniref:Uncharacterized protein n=1 Tax=Nyssa sinensis TaxID=561372 RepID=A0A5J5B986_9ASTE|nr:hypothetical protein F0562_028127 [Nyssa sinensis]
MRFKLGKDPGRVSPSERFPSHPWQALYIIATLGEIRYESHDLEAQLHLQLMSSTEVANKVEELKKRLEEAEMELGTSRSLTDELRGQLAESSRTVSSQDSEIHSLGNEVADLKWQISDLISEMHVVETAASEAEAKHHSEIEVAKVVVVNEQKDKILKLGRKLTFDGYNLCLKKMAKAFLEIDTEVLDHIEVSNVESEDFEDDEVFEDPATPTNP